MKNQMKTLGIICILFAPSIAGPQHDQAQGLSPCALVQQALADYTRVKVGTTREEVQKYFTPDGGAQFPSKGRYVYRKCDYLKIEIEFNAVGDVHQLLSPRDTITKISRFFVDYPAAD